VRTDVAAEGADPNKVTEAIPPQALAVAERLAGPLGVGMPVGEPGLYLCHTLCELGAEPLGRELGKIADFLEADPRTLLVLVMEDYVAEARVVAAMRAAGLARLATTLPRQCAQPTLGKLLGTGKRLVVFSEKGGGTPAWYLPGFDYIQDTPLGDAHSEWESPMPRRSAASCCTTPHHAALRRIMLHYAASCCTTPHHAALRRLHAPSTTTTGPNRKSRS
jgi:hypothetical protein